MVRCTRFAALSHVLGSVSSSIDEARTQQTRGLLAHVSLRAESSTLVRITGEARGRAASKVCNENRSLWHILNISFYRARSAVMDMDVLPEASSGSVMPASQQKKFFKEASEASYRARDNLTPDQQVRTRSGLISSNTIAGCLVRAPPRGGLTSHLCLRGKC